MAAPTGNSETGKAGTSEGRPERLNPLFASVDSLAGVGPKVAGLLSRLRATGEGVTRVCDLLFHMPSGIIDRRYRPKVNAAQPGTTATLEVVVEAHRRPPPGRRGPWRILAGDDTGSLELVFFNAKPDWLLQTLAEGSSVLVSGMLETFDYRLQMVHPDYIAPLDKSKAIPMLEAVYPLTAGLSAKVLRRAIHDGLSKIPELPEWQRTDILERERWPGFGEALHLVHEPDDPHHLDPESAAWRRLAYDELLASQLALALVRRSMTRGKGQARQFDGSRRAAILNALPFSLTQSQNIALSEIADDLKSEHRMLRLLQGDVGSGKTLVALAAMADMAEAGAQSALMAPTELLARQHFETIAPLAAGAGLKVALLTGKLGALEKRQIRSDLESGALDIVVGTHALFQSGIEFLDLGLVVVDEQHRFGVHQRLALQEKGRAPDVLVLTATPIPRSLVLTFFGDMDVSKLTEKPAGRQKIITATVALDRLNDVVGRIVAALERGEQAYWVCPLVSESEVLDIAAAEDRYAHLRQVLGDKVGLVHGRMNAAEKDRAMDRFRSGETRVLVATTVVEVGVDVPEATIMIVEHAERFGLAQLHQLRGRVGRGERPSTCLLLYKVPLGATARARLALMRETEDGFRIAEEDLRLRGEGDLLGVRQSGMPGFQIAIGDAHADLLDMARDDARMIVSQNPDFQSERMRALRHLLYLFGRDDAVRLMRSG